MANMTLNYTDTPCAHMRNGSDAHEVELTQSSHFEIPCKVYGKRIGHTSCSTEEHSLSSV